MKFISPLTFLLGIIISVTTLAHNPDEVTYNIEVAPSGEGDLIIHWTPKAAIDLIRRINPALKNQSLINLEDYIVDFTEYFRDHVHVQINGEMVVFHFSEADFKSHNAIFTMSLSYKSSQLLSIDVTNTSFLDVYRRIQNHVIIHAKDITHECTLDINHTSCKWSSFQALEENSYPSIGMWFVYIVGAVGLGYFLYRMKNKKYWDEKLKSRTKT